LILKLAVEKDFPANHLMLMSAGEVQIKTVTAEIEVLGDIQYGDKVAFQGQ